MPPAAASSARLSPWIPGVATPAFWFVVRSKGDYPSQMEAQRGGTRWLSRDSPPRGLAALCRRERSGEAAFATGRRFQSGFTQVRDAPRPSQAAARCRSAERAPRSVGTWPHGRGCGSWALSPPGHHPPLSFCSAFPVLREAETTERLEPWSGAGQGRFGTEPLSAEELVFSSMGHRSAWSGPRLWRAPVGSWVLAACGDVSW